MTRRSQVASVVFAHHGAYCVSYQQVDAVQPHRKSLRTVTKEEWQSAWDSEEDTVHYVHFDAIDNALAFIKDLIGGEYTDDEIFDNERGCAGDFRCEPWVDFEEPTYRFGMVVFVVDVSRNGELPTRRDTVAPFVFAHHGQYLIPAGHLEGVAS